MKPWMKTAKVRGQTRTPRARSFVVKPFPNISPVPAPAVR